MILKLLHLFRRCSKHLQSEELRSSSRRSRRRCRAFLVESLESRQLLATFTVTSTSDSGTGSFRDAIIKSNLQAGADQIVFAIPGAGVKTISPLTELPRILDPVAIDGNTQSPVGNHWIELDGTFTINCAGLTVTTRGGGSVIKGLIINRFDTNGISISNSSNNTVQDCWIGTDATGLLASPNLRHGIQVVGSNNLVGGTLTKERNVISGNGVNGVFIITAGQNRVFGNVIGLDKNIDKPIGRQAVGVSLSDSTGNRIGGSSAGQRNFLSGNKTFGVSMTGALTTANTIQGNYIGNGAGAATDAGNFIGVVIRDRASSNLVDGNTISGNSHIGVWISGTGTASNRLTKNKIGTNPAGTAALPNKTDGILIDQHATLNFIGSTDGISGNTISGNLLNGIELSGSTTSNRIFGNIIGLGANGLTTIPNFVGINSNFAAGGNLVGDTAPGARNIISGNLSDGVFARGIGRIELRNNYIGLAMDGSTIRGNGGSGVHVLGVGLIAGNIAPNSGNVISGNSLHGIDIEAVNGIDSNTAIARNKVGTDAQGLLRKANQGHGIFVHGFSSDIFIGGGPVASNLISGNLKSGIEVEQGSVGFVVMSNNIGGNASGNAAIPNLDGIRIASSDIGTVSGNTIAGNARFGVFLDQVQFVTIVQNNIGVLEDGVTPFPNGSHGILLTNGSANNTIGNIDPAKGNRIANNGGDGVLIGSLPGLPGPSFTNPAGSGNRVQGNLIYGNRGQAIDLGPNDSATANDLDDLDAGPNSMQNSAVITSAVLQGQSLQVSGKLDSVPGTYRIEFYSGTFATEARRYLGFVEVTIIGTTDAVLSTNIALALPLDAFVTAVTTNLLTGDTSELSLGKRIVR